MGTMLNETKMINTSFNHSFTEIKIWCKGNCLINQILDYATLNFVVMMTQKKNGYNGGGYFMQYYHGCKLYLYKIVS